MLKHIIDTRFKHVYCQLHILCSCRYCEKTGLLGKGENDVLADPDGGEAVAASGEADKDDVGYSVADDEEQSDGGQLGE